jgi:hypothetical protein
MWAAPLLLALQGAASLVAAQLTLPNPAFLPPNASAGATPSSGGFPNPQWSSLLGTLLYFYDEQRSGTLPSTNRVPWRNDSLILEGLNLGIDLTGQLFYSLSRVVFIQTGTNLISTLQADTMMLGVSRNPEMIVLFYQMADRHPLDFSKDTFPLVSPVCSKVIH